jgi:integrase
MSTAEVEELETRTQAYHHSSREARTHTNFNRFVRYYEEVCAARQETAWPAQEFNVACFIVKYCDSLQSVQSLDNALSAIRVEARERCGQEFTGAQEWYLKRVKRGLRKVYRRRTERKRPITMDILAQLVLLADLENLSDIQYITQGYVQHDACLRTAEALALRASDVAWDCDHQGDVRAVTLTIRVSKARYESEPETVSFPSYETGAGLVWCAARFLAAYLEDPRVRARQAKVGPEAFLFPSLKGRGTQKGSYGSFVDWYKEGLKALGLQASAYAGHSFRAGGATDLHTGKVPEVLGRLLGRWRCREAYFLYLRENPEQQLNKIRHAFEAAWASEASGT